MPLPKNAFDPNDADGRAAAAGRRSRGKPKRTSEQKEADRRLEQLVMKQPRLPEDFEPPTASQITAMARSFATGALDFAADTLAHPETQLSDKFQAANLLLRHGASTNAAEQEEINKLTGLLAALQEEHNKTVAEMREEITTQRTELLQMGVELADTRHNLEVALEEKAQAEQDAELARAEAQSARTAAQIASGKSPTEQRAGMV